ncbi:MAG: c-type cytochrome domain-containing protein [Planctomycetota bacterium]
MMLSSQRVWRTLKLGTYIAIHTCCVSGLVRAAELDARERRIVTAVNQSVLTAGRRFQAGDYAESGDSVRTAIRQIEVACKAGTFELHEALKPAMQRIINARAMLELEGVTLPPFKVPPTPEKNLAEMEPDTTSPMADDSGATPGVDFATQVAPVLVRHCGRCHVDGSRGQFGMPNLMALMRGSVAGVVLFPGDPQSSRLLEVMRDGEMPPSGNRVPAADLELITRWVQEGAPFDESIVTTPLRTLASSTTSTPKPVAEPTEAPPRKQTVQFATQIAPLIADNCGGCHVDAMQARGGLRLDTIATLLRGGDSGAIIQPGNGAASLLVQKLKGTADGDRMPAGGRPPLSDDAIQLVSTWIDEGAYVAPALRAQPVGVMASQAWLAMASDSEVSDKRAETAKDHFRLAGADVTRLTQNETDHFALWGDVDQATLDLVGQAIEANVKGLAKLLPSLAEESEAFFHGRASAYVLPRRYDYAEMAKMVEGRSVPNDWRAHWQYDSVDAYIAVVATDADDLEALTDRLASPVAALAIASRGKGIPRWFADGLGAALAAQRSPLTRDEKDALVRDVRLAAKRLKDAKAFLDGKLPPEDADLMGQSMGESLLSRNSRRGLDRTLRLLESEVEFEAAFASGIGMSPIGFIDAWLKWVQ